MQPRILRLPLVAQDDRFRGRLKTSRELGRVAVGTEPIDGGAHGGVDGNDAEVEFLLGVGAAGEHFLAAHAYFFEGGAWVPAPDATGDPFFEEGVGNGYCKGDLGGRRRDAGDGGHLVEDLLEREVFSTEDVAVAGLAFGERGDVSAGDFGDIDEVEAGIHIGRKLAVEEVDEDAAGGGGLGIVGADGSRGVEDDDLLAGLRGFDSFDFGEKLGALVVPDHVFEGDGRVLIDDQAIGAEVHGGDAGGIDEAGDAGFAGKAEELAGAIDVGAVHDGGIADPEAVIGGNVEDGITCGEGRFQAFGLEQIADNSLAANAFEVVEVAGFADEEAEVGAVSGQCFRYVVANESGGACDKNFHRVFSGSIVKPQASGKRDGLIRATALPMEAIWANNSS